MYTYIYNSNMYIMYMNQIFSKNKLKMYSIELLITFVCCLRYKLSINILKVSYYFYFYVL